MAASVKVSSTFVALIWIVGTMTVGTSAETVEVARKCDALTAKAYPPRVIGNPAAGSAYGTGLSEHNYYQKCVANGGNMPSPKKQN
jgi:hypothetical protein